MCMCVRACVCVRARARSNIYPFLLRLIYSIMAAKVLRWTQLLGRVMNEASPTTRYILVKRSVSVWLWVELRTRVRVVTVYRNTSHTYESDSNSHVGCSPRNAVTTVLSDGSYATI